MPKELTEADMADHRITYHGEAGGHIIRAAYVTADESVGGNMIALKDHKHRTVALVNRDAVKMVERLEPEAPAPGFQPTTQIMESRGIPGAAGAPFTYNVNVPGVTA